MYLLQFRFSGGENSSLAVDWLVGALKHVDIKAFVFEAAGLQLGDGVCGIIHRFYAGYPNMNDDDFVAANLDRWLH